MELGSLRFDEVRLDDPLAQLLVEEVQQEYVVRYGGRDETPVDPAEFAPPSGLFLLAVVDDEPVACAGLRARVPGEDHGPDGAGDVELKRMYVRASHRGRGYARALLAEVERRAAALGGRRLVLETGERQPEAIALYTSAGYQPVEPFGHYACAPGSRHLGKALPSA